ncbi:nucleotide-binding protein [Solibacillus silvestris]|uniref:nucleotide-binding protein n=1 Tax=Solibacillus silvestris TaxID=76853 RepID=UPI003F7F2076
MGEGKGTFQKWKKKVNEKVTTISSKTSLAVDRSKARKQIGVIEEEIKVLKQEIGEIVNMNRNSLFSVSMVNYQLAQIETKEKAIALLEQEIEELNERSKLAGIEEEEIGGTVENGMKQDMQVSQTYTCANCSEHYREPIKFCGECGCKMN